MLFYTVPFCNRNCLKLIFYFKSILLLSPYITYFLPCLSAILDPRYLYIQCQHAFKRQRPYSFLCHFREIQGRNRIELNFRHDLQITSIDYTELYNGKFVVYLTRYVQVLVLETCNSRTSQKSRIIRFFLSRKKVFENYSKIQASPYRNHKTKPKPLNLTSMSKISRMKTLCRSDVS